MATVIEQMDLEVSDQTPEPPASPPRAVEPQLDSEAIERLLRRAEQRRARLAAD